MEYISAEEFLKQPKDIQKALINWWKLNLSKGDLFDDIMDSGVIRTVAYYDIKSRDIIPFSSEFKSYIMDCIPLLTEGQLRKFIEDKTGYRIELSYYDDSGYDLSLTDEVISYYAYENLGTDLLQAYWKVAVEIALSIVKEVINNV